MTSARAALSLRDRGYSKARALRGGIGGWRQRGYPMHPARHQRKVPALAPTLEVQG